MSAMVGETGRIPMRTGKQVDASADPGLPDKNECILDLVQMARGHFDVRKQNDNKIGALCLV